MPNFEHKYSRKDRDKVRPVDEERLVEAGGYTVAQWSPDRDHRGGPTEVHLVIEIPDMEPKTDLCMRIKSREAVDLLISVLSEHRDHVWPIQ